MTGVSLNYRDCGTLLKSVEEAQEHAEHTSQTNFCESTEAVHSVVCTSCDEPCRPKIESELHTKRTGHTEYVDKTLEAAKPISLEAPKNSKADVDVEEAGDASTSSQQEEMVVSEVDQKLLAELEAMGFPKVRATRALHFSGSVSLEAAANWVVEHEDDEDIDQDDDTKVKTTFNTLLTFATNVLTNPSEEKFQKLRPSNAAVKVIQWEDFEQDLARLWSLSSALNEAKQKKLALQEKLQSLIQVGAESLNRLNELDEMREKLESRKLVMVSMSMRAKVVEEKVKRQEEQLSTEIRSLLVTGTALSVANKRLQEVNKSLAGEKGYVALKNLQKLLRVRQQYMASQVSLLYPVKVMVRHAHEQELESFTSSSRSGNSSGSKPVDQGSLTISGLHLTMLPFTKMSFFTDKKEVQRSATALGYVAHAVSLIASYLEVPLHYPLRLGGSRTYIRDYAPSVDPTLSDLTSNSLVSTNLKPTEFPLFLGGQDATRAAYAVFLLNKDLEQLLNFIGVKSLGPRHVLANLKELTRTILSPAYIDT